MAAAFVAVTDKSDGNDIFGSDDLENGEQRTSVHDRCRRSMQLNHHEDIHLHHHSQHGDTGGKSPNSVSTGHHSIYSAHAGHQNGQPQRNVSPPKHADVSESAGKVPRLGGQARQNAGGRPKDSTPAAPTKAHQGVPQPFSRPSHEGVSDGSAVIGCVWLERSGLRGIRDLLVAQRSLLQELELRWASLLKSDDELASMRGDSMSWASCVRPEGGNGQMGDYEASPHDVTPAFVDSLEGASVADEHAYECPLAETDQVLGEDRNNNELVLSEVKDGFKQQDGRSAPTPTTSSRSKVVELATAYQRELDTEKTVIPDAWWVQAVKSAKFDLLIGAIIVFNTLVNLASLELHGLGAEKRLDGTCIGASCSEGPVPALRDAIELLEHFFTASFVLEMLARMAANGRRYLFDVFHLLDIAIVLISVIDLWILTPLGSQGMKSVSVLRMARLVKLAKVFRVVRVLKAFEPLRVLVTTIAHSIGALAWSMTILFVLEIIGSIFLAQLLQPFVDDENNDLDLRRTVWMRFGTWSRAMLTVYEITMAPGGFIQYRFIIEKVNPLVGVFFVVYGCTVTFAIIRVITALFLKATLSVCEKEEIQASARMSSQRNIFAQRLHECHEGDHSGGINFEEFESLLKIPQMTAWLTDAGLSVDSAVRLFVALKDADSGEADFMQFLDAMTQMRGPPRTSDLVVLGYESRRMLDQTTQICRALSDEFGKSESNDEVADVAKKIVVSTISACATSDFLLSTLQFFRDVRRAVF